MNPMSVLSSGRFRLIFLVLLLAPLVLAWSLTRTGDESAAPTPTSDAAIGALLATATSTTAAVPPVSTLDSPPATSTPTEAPTTAPPEPTPTATLLPALALDDPMPTLAPEPRQAPADPTPWLPDQRPDDQRVAPRGHPPDLDLHYALHVTELSAGSGFVRASQTVTIEAFNEPVPDSLYFQVPAGGYGFFTLDGMTLDGAPVEPTWINDGATMVLDLPGGLAAPVEIGIEFQLNVGGPEPSGWGYLAVDADVLRLGYWFPQISDDHPFSLTLDPSYTRVATFDVTLDIDPALEFSHSGEITGVEELADGRVRYHLHGDRIRDFDFAFAPSYVTASTVTQSGVTIEYSWRAGLSPDVTERVLSVTADAVDQLTELLGPYPWPTLRIADGGPSLPGGIEYGNLIWINPAYPQLDRLIYHEVGHMWFYGIIGTRTLIEGWIDEGGAEFFERGLPTGFTEWAPVPAGGYCCPLDARWEELPQTGSGTYFAIYEQGQRFYMAVLEAMGWDDFWAAMRQIYDDFAFDIVTAYDMLRAWQSHSSVDLRPLFNDTFRYTWIDDLPDPGVTSRQGWLPLP